MQPAEQRRAAMAPAHEQRGQAIPSALRLPDAERQHLEVLVEVLVETLAAARDTVARCERALALVAGRRAVARGGPAHDAWHADDAASSHRATPPVASSNGSTPSASMSTEAAVAPCRVTRRETAVVRLIAAGLSNKEIASTLGVSVRTIERHITNLYRKIGARGKADATAWAVRQNLV